MNERLACACPRVCHIWLVKAWSGISSNAVIAGAVTGVAVSIIIVSLGTGIWTFMSLLFGAVCATLGGILGGDRRDEFALRGLVV